MAATILFAALFVSVATAEGPDGWPTAQGDAARSGGRFSTWDSGGASIPWETWIKQENHGYVAPILVGRTLYVADHVQGAIKVISADTGELLDSIHLKIQVDTGLAYHGGALFAGGVGTAVYAVYTENGTVKWKHATTEFVGSMPVVADGMAYFAESVSTLVGVDETTGERVWSFEVDEVPWRARLSSATVADGTVYFTSRGSKTYALNASTGALLWKTPVDARVEAVPLVVGGTILVATDDGVVALSVGDGAHRWTHRTERFVFPTLAAWGGIAYAVSYDGMLWALDAETGKVQWRREVPVFWPMFPTVANGKVYVGGNERFFVLDALTGRVIGSTPSPGWLTGGPVVVGDVVFARFNSLTREEGVVDRLVAFIAPGAPGATGIPGAPPDFIPEVSPLGVLGIVGLAAVARRMTRRG